MVRHHVQISVPLPASPRRLVLAATALLVPAVVVSAGTDRLAAQTEVPADTWAFEATFDGTPSSPSQDLLPRELDYVVTHRTHPMEHFTKDFAPFPADHGEDCAGPDPSVAPLPQHLVRTDQLGDGDDPDDSFFVCHGHMMTAMGEVSPYSISSFWPRQEFDFADGGVLEFDVNMNLGHENRSWWEIMIVPREQLRVASGPVDSAIDETYPADRIVLDFRRQVRRIKVGTGETAPNGWLADERQFAQWDWAYWSTLHPDDPALHDRRIRRTMRVELGDDSIRWGIETADGSFDDWEVDVPGGLPFDRGLVLFKTHAYTPLKDGNTDTYTFHWDDVRFDGPVVGRYDAHPASGPVYLQRNGDRPIGNSETVTIDVPAESLQAAPVLFGQVHAHQHGQVLVSINGGPDLAVDPHEFDPGGCPLGEWNDWRSFRMELDPDWLQAGENTFTWTVGPRSGCPTAGWDGFSVKFLQIQTDDVAAAIPPPSSAPATTVPPASTAVPTTTAPGSTPPSTPPSTTLFCEAPMR